MSQVVSDDMLCILCSECFGGVNLLVRHLKSVRGLLPGKILSLKCGQTGCSLEFGSFSGFRKHLNRVHSGQISVQSITEGQNSEARNVPMSCDDDSDLCFSDVATSSVKTADLSVTNKNTKDACGAIVAQLLSAGVGLNTVDVVVSSLEEIVEQIQSQVKETALNAYPQKMKCILELQKHLVKFKIHLPPFIQSLNRSPISKRHVKLLLL